MRGHAGRTITGTAVERVEGEGAVMSMRNVARLWAHCAACALLIAVAGPVEAMNVSPMVVELTATGSRSTARIQVLNVLHQDLPYEVRVYRVEFNARGEMAEAPADADFIVFPPQGVLKFNQRQMVRLQWVGGAIDSSRAYYASINQLPVALDPAKVDRKKASVDVQMVYHMKVLVTVAPPGAAPKVSVESAQPAMITLRTQTGAPTAGGPVPGVVAVVRNSGKRYAMLAGVNWAISGKGVDNKPLRVVLTAGQMGEILGAGYVPALTGRRTFEIPTGVKFGNAPISIKFSD